MELESSHLSMVVSGSLVEINRYENAFLRERGFIGSVDKEKKTCVLTPEQIRRRNLAQARTKLYRLIKCNFGKYGELPKHLVLTFHENFKNLKVGNRVFSEFIQKFNYFIFKVEKKITKYVAVPEFQKRGALHYHTLFFNVPWFDQKKVAALWKPGFIKIQAKYNVKDIAKYIVKDMVKNFDDRYRLHEKKFFSSRNLKRPVFVRDEKTVMLLKKFLKPNQLVEERTFPSPYLGQTLHQEYDLGKYPRLFNKLAEEYQYSFLGPKKPATRQRIKMSIQKSVDEMG